MGYIRNFIILKGDMGVGGRAILEQRNGRTRILISLQGIRQGEYSLYAFTRDSFKRQWLKVGSRGRFELNWELTELSVDEIKAVCILTDRLQPVLTGYGEEGFNWQRILYKPVEENKPIEEAVQENREEIQVAEALPDEQEIKGHLKEIITEFDKNIQELRAIGNEDTAPFGDDGYVWEKTDLRQLYNTRSLWKFANNPFVVHGYRCYHHIYLGKSEGSCALAVPCVYCKGYTLESQLQGFQEFRALKEKELKEGQLCYCIIKL